MQALTERQRQLLDLVRDHIDSHGCPPTRVELARRMGFRSPNAAEQHLRALVRKGYIALEPGGNRNIRLLQEPRSEAGLLPVIGRVAAGAPILAAAHVERRLRIDPALFEPPADYLLRVKGLSLRDAGILEDDWLAVHRSSEARRGQLVVVRLGEEVTAKRLEFHRGRIRLLAENPDYPPIEIDPAREHCAIEGIVVGVIRTGRL